MEMKNILLGFALITALLTSLVGLTGCSGATGGGWATDEETGSRIVFGFNVKYVGEWGPGGSFKDYKGNFQLNDIENNVRIHAVSKADYPMFTYYPEDESFTIWEATVNGESGYWIDIYYIDWWDPTGYWIFVVEVGGSTPVYEWYLPESEFHGNINIKE